MNNDFWQQVPERTSWLRADALMDGLLAIIAVGLVAFGVDALFRAMH